MVDQTKIVFLQELQFSTKGRIWSYQKEYGCIVDGLLFNSNSEFYISYTSERIKKVFFDRKYKEVIESLIDEGFIHSVKYGENGNKNQYHTKIKISWSSLNIDFEKKLNYRYKKSISNTRIANIRWDCKHSQKFSKIQMDAIDLECQKNFQDHLTLPFESKSIQFLIHKMYSRHKDKEINPKPLKDYIKKIRYMFETASKWQKLKPDLRIKYYSSEFAWKLIGRKGQVQTRIHSPFTWLSKIIRNCIDWGQYYNIYDHDFSCCFPTIICLTSSELIDGIDLKESTFYDDIKKNELYLNVQKSFGISRSKAKQKVQHWINCRHIDEFGYVSNTHQEFENRYPQMADFCYQIKSINHNYKAIYHWASYREAKLIHGRISERLLNESIDNIKIHDGIQSLDTQVAKIMFEESEKEFGTPILVTTENLRKEKKDERHS